MDHSFTDSLKTKGFGIKAKVVNKLHRRHRDVYELVIYCRRHKYYHRASWPLCPLTSETDRTVRALTYINHLTVTAIHSHYSVVHVTT